MGTSTWIPANATWRKASYSGNTGGDCIECVPLGNVSWQKSSYSGSNGGDCVECATLDGATWQKSSHSGDSGGCCVEIAPQPCRVAVRDSKNPEGPVFAVTAAAFTAFTVAARRGAFGEPDAR